VGWANERPLNFCLIFACDSRPDEVIVNIRLTKRVHRINPERVNRLTLYGFIMAKYSLPPSCYFYRATSAANPPTATSSSCRSAKRTVLPCPPQSSNTSLANMTSTQTCSSRTWRSSMHYDRMQCTSENRTSAASRSSRRMRGNFLGLGGNSL